MGRNQQLTAAARDVLVGCGIPAQGMEIYSCVEITVINEQLRACIWTTIWTEIRAAVYTNRICQHAAPAETCVGMYQLSC
jgi:hypothetical protein